MRRISLNAFLLFCLCPSVFGQSIYLDSALRTETNSLKIFYAQKGLSAKTSDSVKGELHYILCEALSSESKYSEGLEHAFASLQFLKGKQSQSKIYNRIGSNYIELLQYEKSFGYLKKSFEQSVQLGDSLGMAKAKTNIGNAYLKLGKMDSALISYQFSYTICVRNKINKGVSILSNNLAGIYKDKKQFDKAISYYEQALRLANEEGQQNDIAFYLNNIGSVYADKKEFQLALTYKLKSLEIIKKINDLETMSNLYPQLAKIHAEMGNYREAHRYDTLNAALLENVFKKETAGRLAEMEAKYKSAEKELENQHLKESNLKNQSVIQLQRLLVASVVVILVLVSFFAFKWYRDRQKQKRISQLLELQKEEIEKQKENLEGFNSLKDKIFSLISHDLRSPLNTLQALIALYNRDLLSEEESKKYFKEIESRLLSTSGQLDNLLQWSRNQIAGVLFQSRLFDVSQTVNETIQLLKPQASIKRIDIKNEVQATLVFADEEMIRVVIRNLLANAIKFSKPDSEIKLTASTLGNMAEVKITDHGLGISEDQMKNLWQVGPTRRGTANETGTGIGLSLCKEFIEKNGGTIGVISKENDGSTFWFRAPTGPK